MSVDRRVDVTDCSTHFFELGLKGLEGLDCLLRIRLDCIGIDRTWLLCSPVCKLETVATCRIGPLHFPCRFQLCFSCLQILSGLKTSGATLQIGILVGQKQLLLGILVFDLANGLDWLQWIFGFKAF